QSVCRILRGSGSLGNCDCILRFEQLKRDFVEICSRGRQLVGTQVYDVLISLEKIELRIDGVYEALHIWLDYVFGNDVVAGLRYCKIRFGRNDHAERLESGCDL